MTIEELKQRKQELGYTNAQLADISGVPLGTVMKVLSGATKSPRRGTILALEKALSPYQSPVSDYIFSRSAPKPPEGKSNPDKTSSRAAEKAYMPDKSLSSGNPLLLRESPLIYGTSPKTDHKHAKPHSSAHRLHTVEDYYALSDDIRTELIDGVFYDMASPSVTHQLIIGEMYLQLKECEKKHKGRCRVILSPCDVQLDQDNYTILQPDILVVCDMEKIRGRSCYGAPDLTVEVLSPSNSSHDCILKLRKYKNAGVREYWIVDPQHRQIIVYILDDPDIPRFETYSFEDTIPIGISGGNCSVNFKEIAESLLFMNE